MGYYYYRILKVEQKVLQPHNRLCVEVVGRLVEYENIWIAEECLRKQNFNFLLTVEFAHKHIVIFLSEFEFVEKRRRVALRFPSSKLGKLRFEFCREISVLFAEVGLCVQSVFFIHYLYEFLVSHKHGTHNGIFVKIVLILIEYAYTLVLTLAYGTSRRLQIARQNL